MVLTNEIPRFTDSSGALASRFVILVLTRSFYGQEDPGLTDELLTERPGILNWALDGLDRLRPRGRFEQPASALAAVRRLEDLSSPVGAFVRDRCVIDPARHVTKDSLWADWKDWCSSEGREHAGTKAVFMRDLSAAFPGLRTSRPKIGEKRVHVCEGIDLRRTEDPDDEPDGMLDLQSTTPLTTPDQDPVGQGSGPNRSTGNRTSEGSVRGGQGSGPLYVQPESNGFTKGDVVRHDREPARRFRFVQYRGDGSAHVREIELGEAVKSRFFRPGELALVERAGEVADDA